MKKLIFLNLMLLLISWSINAQPTPVKPDGYGTQAEPYQISSLANLYWITTHKEVWNQHFIQTDDIDASATEGWSTGGWLPIGDFYVNDDTGNRVFSGSYDGQGHTISELHVANTSAVALGLFGVAGGATFKNLGIINVGISNASVPSGGLVGYAVSTTVNNCFSTGDIAGDASAGGTPFGGLAGTLTQYSSATNCYSTCNVSGGGYVGGLVGFNNNNSMITNSYHVTGTVTGSESSNTGGLAGYNSNTSIISKCFSSGTVNGFNSIGGLVGLNDYYATITNSYSRCNCSSNYSNSGGLVGYNYQYANITNCFSTGSVIVPNMKGLVGGQSDGAATVNSYWDTETSGTIFSNGGTGKITDEMKDPSTFTETGWDFETIWYINADINDGYPNLQALAPTCTNGTIALFSGSNTQTVCANTEIECITYAVNTGDMHTVGASISTALPPGLTGHWLGEENRYMICGTPTVAGVYTYTVTTIGTDFPCDEATATGTITVEPSFTPTVSITSSDDDNKICSGTNVVFTATPHNTGGGTVAYRWYLNENSYDAWNKSTWEHSDLDENGYDLVRCEITVTGGTCLASTTAVSDVIDNDVYNSYPEPSVTITSSNNGNEICDGTNVIFTATPENTGGGIISYQWTYNTTTFPAGNSNTWSNSELHNGDVVSCVIKVTDAACFDEATAASNEIITNVIPKVEVTIASDDADNSIIYGTSVTFTPTLLNYIDGTIEYNWYKFYPDSEPFYVSGENTYTTTSLKDGDEIVCIIIVTGSSCPKTTSLSNMITVRVDQCISGQADCFEPNNSLANAALLIVDVPEISANILNAKDLDWFKFTTEDAGYYTINFNANGGKESVDLCNARGQKLRSGSKTSLIYNLLANTTYYIKVCDAKLKTPSPCYSLSVSYSEIMPAGGFIEANMDLKAANIEPVSDGICKIWPNPTKNEFQLYNGNETPVQVRVMDVTGRQIETIENVGIAETIVFGSKYKPGIYFVNTSENGVQKVFKLIKQ